MFDTFPPRGMPRMRPATRRSRNSLRASKTGDVILWSGEGNFSGTVRFFAHTIYSHVNIVLVKVDPVTQERTVYVIESTQSSYPLDYFYSSSDSGQRHGREKTGPKLVILAEKLYTYKGTFLSVRHLSVRKSALDPRTGTFSTVEKQRALNLSLKQQMMTYLAEVIDRPYESDPVELGASVMGVNCADNTRAFVCTELTIQVQRRAGICGPGPAGLELANNYLPNHFRAVAPGATDPMNTQYPFCYGPKYLGAAPQKALGAHVEIKPSFFQWNTWWRARNACFSSCPIGTYYRDPCWCVRPGAWRATASSLGAGGPNGGRHST